MLLEHLDDPEAVEAVTNHGRAPLHAAATAIDPPEAASTVQWLLNNGADVNAYTNHGITPLHLAIVEGLNQIARQLVQAGADPYQVDADGESAMSMASRAQKAACFNITD